MLQLFVREFVYEQLIQIFYFHTFKRIFWNSFDPEISLGVSHAELRLRKHEVRLFLRDRPKSIVFLNPIPVFFSDLLESFLLLHEHFLLHDFFPLHKNISILLPLELAQIRREFIKDRSYFRPQDSPVELIPIVLYFLLLDLLHGLLILLGCFFFLNQLLLQFLSQLGLLSLVLD